MGSIRKSQNSLWLLSLGALGVVYGDIGTSPLYAFRECFHLSHGLALNADNILGILSVIFWTLILIICGKYMVFLMRADNKGEGGILSLMSLALSTLSAENKMGRRFVTWLGLFGAALLVGDGMITPAISVLSAMEGIQILSPGFMPFVIPLTIAIVCLLFFVQRFGTGKIGTSFGPIILVWFLTLGYLGMSAIIHNPAVLIAVNPLYAIEFFVHNSLIGFLVLGAVCLVVTGGEALYADMGHFGKKPIRLAWFMIAMPALTLNYFGQGALLLEKPEAIQNPFYLLAPDWAQGPLVVLSTMAAVIASQALISGVFSLTRQAVQLGFAPRLRIIHTSVQEIGQIYIPFMNGLLLIGVIWLVLTFKTSSDLAAAYGIAVTWTMLISVVLAVVVAMNMWKWNVFQVILFFGVFGILDLAFVGATTIKFTHGGWVPVAVGAVIYLLMSTWRKGRKILADRLKMRSLAVADFLAHIQASPPMRVPGSAIYMAGDLWGVPVPLLHNMKHNKVLHETVAILSIQTKEEPFIPKDDRIVVNELASGFYRIIAYYGFMETPKIKHILEACRDRGIQFPIQETTFVLGRETILTTGSHEMSIWREKIFAFMARNAERPTSFFRIPPNQVIEVGIQIEI